MRMLKLPRSDQSIGEGQLYYPGVSEREKAKTITLKHGEIVNNLKVVIKK